MKYCIGCGKVFEGEGDYCDLCLERRNRGEQVNYFGRETQKENNVPSMWVYFGLMFLFAIPFAGWISAVVMAFAAKNGSVKNYARAFALYSVIASIIVLLIGGLLVKGVIEVIEDIPENSAVFGDGYYYDKELRLPLEGFYDDSL